jgi:hypothetical protein
MERTGIEPATPCLQSRSRPSTVVHRRLSPRGRALASPPSVGHRQWDLLHGLQQGPGLRPASSQCWFPRQLRTPGCSWDEGT